ncbi:hypothetical protein D3C85_1887550 [compost metagenome]
MAPARLYPTPLVTVPAVSVPLFSNFASVSGVEGDEKLAPCWLSSQLLRMSSVAALVTAP